MKLGEYLPTLPQVSREVIATVLGILGAAWIVSQFPSIRDFVRQNKVD